MTSPGEGSEGSARDRILGRVREALQGRSGVGHPGPLPDELQAPTGDGPVGDGPVGDGGVVGAFRDRFEAAGGEVVALADEAAARAWLGGFAAGFESAAIGSEVPPALRPGLPSAEAAEAALGVSLAVGGAAQTGSLLLSSAGGRRVQLLPPVHLVWVAADTLCDTLSEALAAERDRLPAALALHSGPSKSADIGRIVVTGVHGPGRSVAAILGGGWSPRG